MHLIFFSIFMLSICFTLKFIGIIPGLYVPGKKKALIYLTLSQISFTVHNLMFSSTDHCKIGMF